MTSEVFDILRAAVTIAKNDQIRTVDALRKRLLELYPGKDAAVSEAFEAWPDYASKTV